MEDSAAVFFGRDPGQVEALLRERKVGFLLLPNPRDELYNSLGSAPAGTAPPLVVETDWLWGERVMLAPSFPELVVVRLFFSDGVSFPGFPALEGYRLVHESRLLSSGVRVNDQQVKVFEVVPAARVRVRALRPGTRAVLTVTVRTNQQRRFVWRTTALPDADGVATLRVPYSVGPNGAVWVSSITVDDGVRERPVEVTERQVERGETFDLEF